MSDRTGDILRLLSGQTDFITIDRIAESTGAGVRTIHRDLERLERSLALRGVRVERRRGQGVRLVDPLPEALVPRDALVHRHGGDQRPFLIVLYLLTTARWTKLSELAHVFFVSDSSVSSDLSQVEEYLPPDVTLERQKGVGVRIVAEEDRARLLFLGIFSFLLPHSLLLHGESENNRGHSGPKTATGRLLESVGYFRTARQLLNAIAGAEETCRFTFAPSYSSFLYNYLFIARCRIPEVGPARRVRRCNLDVPPIYQEASRRCVAAGLGDILGDDVPWKEVDVLARVLSVAEPVDVPLAEVADVTGGLAGKIDSVLEHTLADLEERERVWLHDDQHLLDYLRVMFAAAVRRIMLGIPFRERCSLQSGPEATEDQDTEDIVISVLVRRFLNAFRHELADSIPADAIESANLVRRELREAELALMARLESLRMRRAGELVVKILCYEGMGMSVYLAALARDVLPGGARIDARWEYAFGTGTDWSRYDLVISTFTLDLNDTPVLVVAGDEPPDVLRGKIRTAVQTLVKNEGSRPVSSTIAPELSPAPEREDEMAGLSLVTTMSVIHGFFLREIGPDEALIAIAVDALDVRGDCDRVQLHRDFERREHYGSLVFEEAGIRLLHCRSQGIPEPRAGVIRRTGSVGEAPAAPPVLVMAAPVNSPPNSIRVLSELVVALTDYPGFTDLLGAGDRSALQAGLLVLFSRLVS
ncbi:MAG: HTH domain-containing protein [Spirochaetaceae bacterium]|nr:MAG: HTH domain-containing protein [Spirochaetaceae bacterium]